MFCSNCGARLTPSAKFCSECGSRTVPSTTPHGIDAFKLLVIASTTASVLLLFLGVRWFLQTPNLVAGGSNVPITDVATLPPTLAVLVADVEPTNTQTVEPTNTIRPTRTPRPTATDVPTKIPTEIPTATPVPPPDAIVLLNDVNVRVGPGTEFKPPLFQLNAGTQVHIVGQFQNKWFLIEIGEGRTAWIARETKEGVKLLDVLLDTTQIPAGIFRPITKVVQEPSSPGLGELNLKANPEFDSVLILLNDNRDVALSAYLRKDEDLTIRNIPDGTYTAITMAGDRWNGSTFLDGYYPFEYADRLTFRTTDTTYSVWDWTLAFTKPGEETADGKSISANDVPSVTSDVNLPSNEQ